MYDVKESIFALITETDVRMQELEYAIREYSANSHDIVRHDDLAKGKASYRLKNVIQPPIGISTKLLGIGDYIRAPLDHIVVNLIANSGIQPASRNPNFPICVTEKEWNDASGRIKGLDPDCLEMVRSLQPFVQEHGGNPEGHPLAVLQSLSNLTKHNLILYVQITVADSNRHRISSNFKVNFSELYSPPFKEGEEVGILIPGKVSQGDMAIITEMSSFGFGTSGNFGTQFGVYVHSEDDQDIEANETETSDRINRNLASMKQGCGPWEPDAWNDFFANVAFDLKLAQTIIFGEENSRLANLPVLETIRGIRGFFERSVFHKDGLIARLT